MENQKKSKSAKRKSVYTLCIEINEKKSCLFLRKRISNLCIHYMGRKKKTQYKVQSTQNKTLIKTKKKENSIRNENFSEPLIIAYNFWIFLQAFGAWSQYILFSFLFKLFDEAKEHLFFLEFLKKRVNRSGAKWVNRDVMYNLRLCIIPLNY